MFIAALFITAKTWKQLKCPSTDELLKKMWYMYTMEKNNAIGPTQMELEIIVSEVSQKQKDKCYMTSLTCGL